MQECAKIPVGINLLKKNNLRLVYLRKDAHLREMHPHPLYLLASLSCLIIYTISLWCHGTMHSRDSSCARLRS